MKSQVDYVPVLNKYLTMENLAVSSSGVCGQTAVSVSAVSPSDIEEGEDWSPTDEGDAVDQSTVCDYETSVLLTSTSSVRLDRFPSACPAKRKDTAQTDMGVSL